MVDAGTWLGFTIIILGMVAMAICLVRLINAVNEIRRMLKGAGGAVQTAFTPVAVAPVPIAASAGLPIVQGAPVLEAQAVGELATVAGLTAVVMAAKDTGKTFVVRAIRRVDGGAWRR